MVFIAALCASLCAQSNGPIRYFYDDLGRLIRVADQNGNVATYNYDAVGNIISITRTTAPANNGLAILNFTPQQGPPGSSVIIQGQGFSSTLNANVVSFNGAAATVTAATTTSLTATVPSGALTGPISVTVAGKSATSDTNFTVTAPKLVSITVSSTGSGFTSVGQQQQFTATANFSNGTQQNLTTSAVWSSSNTSVATVTQQGLVTSAGPGSAVISATSNGITGWTTLKLVLAVSLTVSAPSSSMPFGTTQQFTASATFSDATVQDVTASATWFASPTSVATVSNTAGSKGLVDGLNVGSAEICALLGSIEDCDFVTITTGAPVSLAITPSNASIPKAIQQQYRCAGTYADSTTRDLTTAVTWSSSNSAVATISNNSGTQGVVTDVGLGSTTISATLGTVNASTTLTLTPPIAVNVALNPVSYPLTPGATVQLAAVLTLSDGSTQDVTQSAAWSSSDLTVATVGTSGSNPGFVTGVAVGVAEITASSGALKGTATVIVNSASAAVVPRFAYSVDGFAALSLYTVNPGTGQLRADGFVPIVGNSTSLGVDPGNQFVYVTNQSSNAVSVFAADAANGSLKEVVGSPFATGFNPEALAADLSGKFVYVANASDNTVSGFTVDRTSGTFTAVPGSPFPVGSSPGAVVIDPSSKFVYVMNSRGNSISAFAIDPTTGALAEIGGSPFTTCNPSALGIDPNGKYLYVGGIQGQIQSSHLDEPGLKRTAGSHLLNVASSCSTGGGGVASTNPTGGAGSEWLAKADESATADIPLTMFGSLRLVATSGPSISVFAIDSTSGALTQVPNSPFPVSLFLNSITTTPSGAYLYAGSGDSVLGFAVNSANGSLNELPDSPYTVTNGTGPVVVDPSGRFVYMGGYEFGINASTGSLTAIGVFPSRGIAGFGISSGSTAVKYVPQFAYVASSGGSSGMGTGADNVSGYSIDASTGALTAINGSPFAEGLFPEFLAADPFGRFLFVANNCSDEACSTGSGSVSTLAIGSGGSLSPVIGGPFGAGINPTGIVVDPSGEFAYVVNSINNNISAYNIDPVSGALSPVGSLSFVNGSPYPVNGAGAAAITTDPEGQLLMVGVSQCPANQCSSGGISTYSIFPTGQLFTFETLPAGTAPRSIAVHPSGNFVLVANNASNNVSVLSNPFSAQVPVPGSPFATGLSPVSVAADPTGRFVYVANQLSDNLSAYTIDPNSGILTPVQGSPFAAGAGPSSVTVDVSGSFVYVTNSGDGTISAFAIDPLSGVLTPVQGSPFATGAAPISITTTGKVQ
jgi:YD repeat-containing protein